MVMMRLDYGRENWEEEYCSKLVVSGTLCLRECRKANVYKLLEDFTSQQIGIWRSGISVQLIYSCLQLQKTR